MPPEQRTPIEQARLRYSGRQFRRARTIARRELDHAVLPVPGDPEGLPVVALATVELWLDGLAIRSENGDPLA